jgi:nucleoid DNA-binding protein
MTLTKLDLVLRLSEDTGLPRCRVSDIVQRTFDHIVAALGKGEKVELRNFGIFDIRVRKARIGLNPRAPEVRVQIPERCTVRFKPGREMRLAVRKLAPKAAAKPPTRPPKG